MCNQLSLRHTITNKTGEAATAADLTHALWYTTQSAALLGLLPCGLLCNRLSRPSGLAALYLGLRSLYTTAAISNDNCAQCAVAETRQLMTQVRNRLTFELQGLALYAL